VSEPSDVGELRSQVAIVNTNVTTAPAAFVSDSFGNPVPGVLVTFTAPGSGASGKFANSTVTTSASTAVADGSGSMVKPDAKTTSTP